MICIARKTEFTFFFCPPAQKKKTPTKTRFGPRVAPSRRHQQQQAWRKSRKCLEITVQAAVSPHHSVLWEGQRAPWWSVQVCTLSRQNMQTIARARTQSPCVFMFSSLVVVFFFEGRGVCLCVCARECMCAHLYTSMASDLSENLHK